MARSEKRQRTIRLTVRFNQQEAAALQSMTDRTGLPAATLARQALLNVPPPRGVRRPTLNQKLAAQILAQLGKIGSNLNQSVKHMHAGHPQWNVFEEACRAVIDMRTGCMEALGRERPIDSDSANP